MKQNKTNNKLKSKLLTNLSLNNKNIKERVSPSGTANLIIFWNNGFKYKYFPLEIEGLK